MILLSLPLPLHPSPVAQALQVLLSVPRSPFSLLPPAPRAAPLFWDPSIPRPTSPLPGSLPGYEVPMLIPVVPGAGAMPQPSSQASIPDPPLGWVPYPLCASASSPQWMHPGLTLWSIKWEDVGQELRTRPGP